MNIGIDIDDTLTKTTEYAKVVFDKYNKDPNKNSYRVLDENDYWDFMEKYVLKIHKNVELKPHAKEVLAEFKKRGWKIYLITARARIDKKLNFGEEDKLITKKYFEKNGIEVDGIVFSQVRKAKACVNKEIDVYIDDREDLLDEVSAAGIKTILITNKMVENDKHIIARNWLDIKKILCEED